MLRLVLIALNLIISKSNLEVNLYQYIIHQNEIYFGVALCDFNLLIYIKPKKITMTNPYHYDLLCKINKHNYITSNISKYITYKVC